MTGRQLWSVGGRCTEQEVIELGLAVLIHQVRIGAEQTHINRSAILTVGDRPGEGFANIVGGHDVLTLDFGLALGVGIQKLAGVKVVPVEIAFPKSASFFVTESMID